MNDKDFRFVFKALTGNLPFPWQEALYQRFMANNIPFNNSKIKAS